MTSDEQTIQEIQKTRRKIRKRQSNFGWIVEVPVHDTPDSPKAIVRLSTWNTLIGKGMHPKLIVEKTTGNVKAYNPANRRTYRLARLVANANSNQTVMLKNENELIQLEENIILINQPEKALKYDLDAFDHNLCSGDTFVEYEWDMTGRYSIEIDIDNNTIKEKEHK